MRLILASGSERRQELLRWLGIPFEVIAGTVDESSLIEDDPTRLVLRLASAKAKAVSARVEPRDRGCLVIGADTVVYVDHEIIGKPKDAADAVRILQKLSGKTHRVYTGVAVVDAKTGTDVWDVEETAVTFRKLSEREIEKYAATGEPLDKGGAYAIQMGAKDFVTKVSGSFTNVVGLPLLTLTKLLEKQGYHIDTDVSKIIFKHTRYWS